MEIHSQVTDRQASSRMLACTLVAMALLASGCAALAGAREGAADVLLPVEDEVVLGEQLQAEILAREQVLDDDVVQGYVQQIGQRLVDVSGERIPEGIEPTFTVLVGDEINAFTIPGGHIYVYTGLIQAANSESELAGVLAHELGHVAERHVAQQLVTQLGVQTVGSMVLGQDPSTLAQLGATIAANGYLLSYSRDSETEADDIGMDLMIESDFAPDGMIGFFQTLRELQGRDPSEVEVFFSSHPPPRDRAEHLTSRLEEAGSPGGAEDANPIAQIQERLPSGDPQESGEDQQPGEEQEPGDAGEPGDEQEPSEPPSAE